MELKQIKELMTAMERAGIRKLGIKEKSGFELLLERQEEGAGAHPVSAPVYHPVYHPPASHIREAEVHHHKFPAPSSTSAAEGAPKQETGKYVTSPMVGTFYSCPGPEEPAFVKVGDRVEENTVVCIIEAMKVMNEVKAGVSGTVAEICVENGHPVEFGTKIFRVV